MIDAKVLVIDRSKWRRGGNTDELMERFGQTALLNDKGFMCCLGFDALASGVKPEDALYRNWPRSLALVAGDHYRSTRLVARRDGDDEVHQEDNGVVCAAMLVNDDRDLTDSEREAELIPILKQLGWDDVQFIDGAA